VAQSRIPNSLSDEAAELLLDIATFVAIARTGVVFEGQGKYRVIVEAPTPEEPTRIARQLFRLARCLMALGYSEHDATGIALRSALHSIPPTREKAIRALADAGEAGATVTDVHKAFGRGNRYAAIWQLDCLEAIGLASVEGTPRDEDPTAVRCYRIADEWADEVARVYASVGRFYGETEFTSSFSKREVTHSYTPEATSHAGNREVA
jgi:hypothetical protein